jgi:hypothetical protein
MRAAGLLSGPIPLTLRVLASLSGKDRWRLRRVAALSALFGSVVTRFAWIGAGRISAKDPTVPLRLPGPGKTSGSELEKKPQEKYFTLGRAAAHRRCHGSLDGVETNEILA